MRKLNKQLSRAKRLRWLILLVTIVCIGVSVTLNVLHAPSNPIAEGVAGLPPVAAFFVIELIARIPASNLLLAVGRIIGSVTVGGIAAVVSYFQQVEYLERLGFPSGVAHAYPFVIDGTMLVTTLSLVEIVRTVRRLNDQVDDILELTEEKPLAVASEAAESPVKEIERPTQDAPAPTLVSVPRGTRGARALPSERTQREHRNGAVGREDARRVKA